MPLILTKREETIFSVILNRPEFLNSINMELLEELNSLLDLLKDDRSVRVIIISGAGEKAFSVGLDYTQLINLDAEEAYNFSCSGQQIFQKIADLPQPVIAAINGQAAGVGLELALACDLRIASANTTFSQPEVSLGLTPCFGGIKRLIQLIGTAQTKELLFLGKEITADEALSLGLVSKVVAYGLAQSAARDLALSLASRSPFALSQVKQLINYFSSLQPSQEVDKEARYFSSCFLNGDQKEGLSSLLAKRKPF